jgi:hypothetical protein
MSGAETAAPAGDTAARLPGMVGAETIEGGGSV